MSGYASTIPNACVMRPPSPVRGGKRPLRLTPLVLLDRLAALVPPPRSHRHRYFGLFARTAAHRTFPRRPRTAEADRK